MKLPSPSQLLGAAELYRDDRLGVYCGECSSILSEFPDECIDLTVTSPPYDNLRNYNGYSFPFEDIAKQLFRVTKQGGVVVWVVADRVQGKSESGSSFSQALYFKGIGFNLHDTMIYVKTSSSLPDRTRYSQVFEYMFVFTKGAIKTYNLFTDKPNSQAGSTNPTKKRKSNGEMVKTRKHYTIPLFGKRPNVWTYEVGYNKGTKDRFAFGHPATFPEALARDHILSWSDKDSVILDPMCGSGTTLKMALLEGRKAIGIDISEDYCTLSVVRCLMAMSDKDVVK